MLFSSFLFNFLTYRARLRLEQASNAAKLHEKWWSVDYYSARRKVYSLIQDWNTGENSGERSTAFLDYFSSPEESENKPDGFEDFAKLVFFFSDLNVYIDEKLINTRLHTDFLVILNMHGFKTLFMRLGQEEKAKSLLIPPS